MRCQAIRLCISYTPQECTPSHYLSGSICHDLWVENNLGGSLGKDGPSAGSSSSQSSGHCFLERLQGDLFRLKTLGAGFKEVKGCVPQV